jgi:hypothetical protein
MASQPGECVVLGGWWYFQSSASITQHPTHASTRHTPPSIRNKLDVFVHAVHACFAALRPALLCGTNI